MIRKRRIYNSEYPRKDLRLIEIIGEGNFGQVWKAKVNNLKHHNLVAVKTNKGKQFICLIQLKQTHPLFSVVY